MGSLISLIAVAVLALVAAAGAALLLRDKILKK